MNGDLTACCLANKGAYHLFSCFIHDLTTGNMSLFSGFRHNDKLIQIYVFGGRSAFAVMLCVIANFMQCLSPDTFVAAYVV